MDAPLPNRQSIRKRGWDYTAAGHYFVTVNTHKGRALFGTVVNGRMVLSEAGRMVDEVWKNLPKYYSGMEVDEAVVMPNHFHGIVRIMGQARSPRGQDRSPRGQDRSPRGQDRSPRGQDRSPARTDAGAGLRACPISLSDIVRNFKSYTTSQFFKCCCSGGHAPEKLWHRNYWDVIVQDEQALANIRNYIRFNPQNYEAVMNVGESRMLGNAELLKLSKLGFLASRGEDRPHGRLPMKAGEAIISGFLSPMERAVFKAGLEHQRALIWVMPFGADLARQPHAARRAIDDGRLLIVSPFSEAIDAPSVRRAAWCNEYALAHCNRMVIGYLNPGGMLSCILSEADPDLEIIYL